MFFNADLNEFECWLRAEYLFNQRSHFGKFIKCVVFGVSSVPGRAIGFHVLTENGAQVARVPIHMLVHRKDAPRRSLEHLELWNSFSDNVCVHEFGFIKEARVKVYLPDKKFYLGHYSQTIDWIDSPAADNPGSIGHKNAHLIKLDEGNYCLQPNNRIYWQEPAFVTKPFKKRPNYVTNEHIFNVENVGWQSEDSEKMFYDVKSLDNKKDKRNT